jgi:hypothetical protein
MVNEAMVNKSRQGIISGPIHTLLMVHLSRSEERRAFDRQRMSGYKRLKTKGLYR